MSWADLLNEKRVEVLASDKAELDNLRSIVSQRVADMQVKGLSHEQQFIIAYDAARTLSVMIVRAAGYRPKKFAGHHNTFAALEVADQKTFKATADYFQICRLKRNDSEYDFAGGITKADADDLIEKVKKFATEAEVWISANYPAFAK